MASPLHSQDIRQVVRRLADEVERIETGRRPAWETVVTSGLEPLDRLLPEGGFRRGTLVEWLAGQAGSGAGALALWIATRALLEGGVLVVIDRRGQFYAPPAVRLGIEPARLIVVRPASDDDHAWAFDQVLRTRGVAAVWGEPPEGDDHMFRRWQLAAETSGTLGLLVRDIAARAAPSWAELRLAVPPLVGAQTAARRRRVQVELVRARGGRARGCRAGGGRAGDTVEIEIPADGHDYGQLLAEQKTTRQTTARRTNRAGSDHDDETRDVPMASPVAAAKTSRPLDRERRA